MHITGSCHCGNISFVLDCRHEPAVIPARACTCSFCTKHGAVWTSFSAGALRVGVEEPALVSRYTFGTKTAQFHLCARCGVLPLVTSRIDGRLYAAVNANTCEAIDRSLIHYAATSFDGESDAARQARRQQNWIADVEFASGSVHPLPGN